MKKLFNYLIACVFCCTGWGSLLAQPAQVQIIHNAADPAAEVVDIYVQFNHDEIKLEDVAFRTATPFLELPSGTPINVIISPANSQDSHDRIRAFHDIHLQHGETYHIVANGLVSHQGFAGNPDHRETAFDLFIFENARLESEEESGENVDIRVFHGVTDAPEVGVNANGEAIIPGFSYGDISPLPIYPCC